MKVHLILMLAFTATACAWQPSLVVMVGPAEGVSSLAGEWSGEYGSSETERSGTVWFKLAAGRDTAYGDAASVDDPIRAR